MKIKGQKRSSFIDQAIKNGGQPIFYVLRCFNKNESFIKVGISVNHIITRYGSPKAMPYDFEILLEYPSSPEAVYDMEVKYKEQMEQYHYEPSIPFNGSKTECFRTLSAELEQAIHQTSTEL